MGSPHLNTRSSKSLDEENRKKAARRANYKDAAQDIAGIVLSTLEQAAAFAPVPYLQQAAGLAIGLVDMVQSTSDNKAAFTSLATDACGLVYTATNVWKDRDENRDGTKIPQDLVNHLEEVLRTMEDIMHFAEMRAARGFLARFLSHKADADGIRGYRVRLKDALDRFGMQSHITVRDAVARIQDQQDAILDALKDHTSTTEVDTNDSPHATSEERSPSSKVASDRRVALPASPAPRPSPHTFSSFTAFANITNNGSGIFNSVNGDYVIHNSTANNSSVNSGNVLNVSTANSNNVYDTGRNGWPSRLGRNRKGIGDDVGITKTRAIPVQNSGRRGRGRVASSVLT
ncbi:hypothetical protein PC9H_011183 [Pleurotus ostreatus]|uniref:Uncharacterized protein n=1 Tax=Pleurotus ostreatus TaxID=5322 RepID=A0A8H6ZNI4_PLEOS|nr:uncharacterized protein PC9H_011183 [Pleurotus ostreatus]KAF7423019.1 hypothetical protein PC9H_011183 [Pleurotus ostreatus]